MLQKIYTPEQIIGKLSEAEIRLVQGEPLEQSYLSLTISDQTFLGSARSLAPQDYLKLSY
jgi:hypothetical protein